MSIPVLFTINKIVNKQTKAFTWYLQATMYVCSRTCYVSAMTYGLLKWNAFNKAAPEYRCHFKFFLARVERKPCDEMSSEVKSLLSPSLNEAVSQLQTLCGREKDVAGSNRTFIHSRLLIYLLHLHSFTTCWLMNSLICFFSPGDINDTDERMSSVLRTIVSAAVGSTGMIFNQFLYAFTNRFSYSCRHKQ